MKKVLYLSNIETPYRVRFFNLLAQHCDLTVLYERENSSNRDKIWAKSERSDYTIRFLNGFSIRDENSFSLRILRELVLGYDKIIVGCYNSPVQMMMILAMRLLRIPYIINLDGEPFLEGKGMKARLKRFFLRGAAQYLVAGEKAADSLRKYFPDKPIVPYFFSSLTDEEIQRNAEYFHEERNGAVLVVGQYFPCKGLDVVLKTALLDETISYKFVGLGLRTELFLQDYQGKIPSNVEVIPFLQKQELEEEYRNCVMLVLPSRQECWGLVINEAASFGMPIVSTWGSGAAVEFLAEKYPQYLADPGDAEALLRCIVLCLAPEGRKEYSTYLVEKSRFYTIERSVEEHLKVLE